MRPSTSLTTGSVILTALLVSAVALAKPWQGIEPGTSTRDDVVKAFGEPSKTLLTKDGKEAIGYFGAKAPKAAQQAQFRIDPKTNLVERIDVFPASPVLKKQLIEKYGEECPEGILPEQPCYVKKVTEDLKPYFLYVRLGLAVFFKSDGDTVQTLVFTAVKK
jgi:hypothetical protein